MKSSSNRRMTTERAILVCMEALIVSALILSIIAFVAGRYPGPLRRLPMLTFDTSSVRSQLVNQSISDPGNVQDWYEPHYLSVCKGRWQSTAMRLKNQTSTTCEEMPGGYTFSLPDLLAKDSNLPSNSSLFSSWSFAVLPTEESYVCLVLAFTLIGWTFTNFFVSIIKMPKFTAASLLNVLRVGFITSILSFVTLIIMSASITGKTRKILRARLVTEEGVAWSTGGFYVLIWLATGLMCVAVIVSVVLAFRLRPLTKESREVVERKHSELSDVH